MPFEPLPKEEIGKDGPPEESLNITREAIKRGLYPTMEETLKELEIEAQSVLPEELKKTRNKKTAPSRKISRKR